MDNLTVSLSKSPLNKDITLLTVKGSMDTNTISEFDKNFQLALMDKCFKLVVDLKDVYYISSAGWGLFVSEIRRIRNEKGDLVLAGMSPDVLDVFDLLQFNTILKFFPDVESAVRKGFEGLPPRIGKATNHPSKSRVKKAEEKIPSLEFPQEPIQIENPPNKQDPTAAPEPEVGRIRASHRWGLLLDWRFWSLGLLVAVGILGINSNWDWKVCVETVQIWAGIGK